MTSVYDSKDHQIPVTVCHAPVLTVTQIKTIKKDGYNAIQLAVDGAKKVKQPLAKKLKKLKIKISPKFFIEFKPKDPEKLPKVGDTVSFDQVFAVGDKVKVTGRSKGHGFAGVIKRHGFHRQPVTRGQSDRTRAPGSIGAQTPGRVIKGKKMPGHFGNKNNTISYLTIVDIGKDKSTVSFKGPMPGYPNSYLVVKK